MVSPAPPTTFLTNIQILRFVAAFLVVFGHVITAADRQMTNGTLGVSSGEFILNLGAGVDVFFIISGFIMFYLCHDKFGQKGTSMEFLSRRFMRVIPTYWIFTALMIASVVIFADQVTTPQLDVRHIAASMAFIPWPNPDGALRPVLKLGWTLNYEIMFYCAFAIALTMRKRVGLTLLFASFGTAAALNSFISADHWILKFWSDPIILEFLMGIGLAALFLHGGRLSAVQAGMLGFAGSALLLFVGPLTGWTGDGERALSSGLPALMICAAFALGPDIRDDMPINRFAVLLGTASYCLYLSHPFTLNAVERIWIRISTGPASMFLLAACLTSIAVSVALYFLMERPLLNQMSRLAAFSRRKDANVILRRRLS
ncbi:acyltransferase family protein [Terrihabitans sp. B22-R8]|uniref:acyltransferase family protein n=1 Tax=Terrihabitans sp. B22-R8 TaxID=3425128 RepID=UPI00403D34AF